MAQQLATAFETFDQVVDFLEHFTDLEDPRQRAKVLYPLDEVLLLCLLGALAGCESWVEIAKFGEKKLAQLSRDGIAMLKKMAGRPGRPAFLSDSAASMEI